MSLPIHGGSVRSDVPPRAPIASAVPKVESLDVLAIWQKVFDGVTSTVQRGANEPAVIDLMHSRSPPSDDPAQKPAVRPPTPSSPDERPLADAPMAWLAAGDRDEAAPARDDHTRMPLREAVAEVASGIGDARADAFEQVGAVAQSLGPVRASSLTFFKSVPEQAAPGIEADASISTALAVQEALVAVPEAWTSHSDESVLVFRDKHRIEVVVRNTALAADAAVRCAMETARQIVGHDRGLRQVTLNGRTVYASADPPRPSETDERRGSKRLLVFAC